MLNVLGNQHLLRWNSTHITFRDTDKAWPLPLVCGRKCTNVLLQRGGIGIAEEKEVIVPCNVCFKLLNLTVCVCVCLDFF